VSVEGPANSEVHIIATYGAGQQLKDSIKSNPKSSLANEFGDALGSTRCQTVAIDGVKVVR